MASKQSFLNKIKPFCYGCWIEYGVLPSIAAAQTILESSWGNSTLSSKYNNYHGIKAVKGFPSVPLVTTEYRKGVPEKVVQYFTHFPSPSVGFNYYGSLIKRRYPKTTGEKDAYQAARGLVAGGYATSPNYVTLVMSVINSNNLISWDKDALKGGKGGYKGTFDKTTFGNGGDVILPELIGDQYRTFNNNFIEKNTYTRPKTKIKGVNGIVLHDAGSKGLSAGSVRTYLAKGGASKKDGGLHIIVDKTNTVCIVPLDEKVYHANGNKGKSVIKGDANDTTLSIGICRESDGTYHSKTLARAIAVVSELANAFGFPTAAIVREYDINESNDPVNFVENQFDYSTFLGLVNYQKNQNTPLMNEDLERYYEALSSGASEGATGGDFGDYREFKGDFTRKTNSKGVYDFLYDLGNQVVSKFKSKYPTTYISSGLRQGATTETGTVSDHATGLALDIACGGIVGERYYEMAKTLAGHPYVKYVIGSDKWNPGNSKNFVRFPYGGHMNHLHISAHPPAQAKKNGDVANKKDDNSKPLPPGDIDVSKGYVIRTTKTTIAYQTDSEKGTTEKKYSAGNVLPVLSVGMHGYRVGDSAWVRKKDVDKTYKLQVKKKGKEAPIGTVKLTANAVVKTRASYSAPNYLSGGAPKIIPKSSNINVFAKENGMFRISTEENYNTQQWVASAYGDFSSELIDFNNGNNPTETPVYMGTSMNVVVGAYSPNSSGVNQITATGVNIKETEASIVAVDTELIPLHSLVYIPGMGTYRAEDSKAPGGSAVDILMYNDAEALRWGRRNIEIIVLDDPGEDDLH